jgi:uncharacterized protein
MKRKDALAKLRAAENAIRACGVAHLFLFGSVARDEADENSDVDVFVDRDPKKTFSLIELWGLSLLLEDVLGTSVDVGTRGGLHPVIRGDAEKTAIQVF